MTSRRPIDVAIHDHYVAESPRSFGEDLAFYLANGYVYAGEEMFVMARPVSRKGIRFVLDYTFKYEPRDCDTWFVYLGVGDSVTRFFDIAPFKMPFVSWHRREDPTPKVWPWEKFYKKAQELKNNGQH